MVRKGLSVYLCLWMLLIGGMLPLQSLAMLAPSVSTVERTDLASAQTTLEAKLVSQRLSEIGLSEQEIQGKMAELTPAQIHDVAQNLDGLQMGGDVLLILGIVAAVILVLALISGVTHGLGHTAHDVGHDVGHHDSHAVVH